MIRILTFVVFAVLMVVPAFANCDAGEKQLVLGLANNDAKSAQRLAADQLKLLLDRDLQGKACLQVVSDQEKFADAQVFDSLKKGAAVLALPKLSSLSNVVREYRIFALPFAFANFQSVTKFQASPEWLAVQPKLSSSGVQSLGFVHGGFDQLVQRKQVLNPENAIGIRFDTTSGGGFSDIVSGVKGISKRRNNKSIAQGLADGDFDIAPITWENLSDPKLREALNSVVETNHAYRGFQLVVSSAWIESLEAALRTEIFQTVQRGLNQIAFETVRRERSARNSLMRANKPVLALSRDQWLRWRSSVSRVWTQYSNAHGLALIVALQNANRLP